jgi:hypothetical protein
MSLGAPDEQALDEIGRRLHAEDPRLGLLFGIFARLTRWERLDPPGLATRLRRRSRRPRDRRWFSRNGRPSGWAWVVPLALSVLFLVSITGFADRCETALTGYGPAQAAGLPGHCLPREPPKGR